MKILNRYKNGNYEVKIYSDGTKIRFTEEDEFNPVFPESMDIKVTNFCKMNCKFCHENSTENGKHGDLNAKFFDTLKAGMEIAVGGGSALSHPNLIPFLKRMKKQGIICNITVNQISIAKKKELIDYLIEEKLIYGLGISYTFYNEDVIKFAKEYKNSVLHLINGIILIEDLKKIYSKDLKILLLGYKKLRRGENYYSSNSEIIEKNKKDIFDNLKEILSSFKVVSFDNLSIKQLEPKRLLSKEQYDLQYMGDDGQFTMYIDLVKEEFAVSSTRKERFKITDNINEMFKKIRK